MCHLWDHHGFLLGGDVGACHFPMEYFKSPTMSFVQMPDVASMWVENHAIEAEDAVAFAHDLGDALSSHTTTPPVVRMLDC